MPQQDSNKASVAFCDVATYFSEEDWTRLHEWQKELYKNVMNEIHQALISLGPLIANSVVSLRTKDKEDHCPMDHEGRERNDLSSRFPNHYPDTSVSMEDQLNTGVSPLENKGRETSSRAVGHMFNTSVVSCRMKEERACYPMHNQDSERSDDIISPLGDTNNNGALSAVQGVGHQNPVNPPNSKEIAQHDCFKSDEEEGFPFLSVDFCMRKEEQSSAVLIDDVHPESRESSSDPSSELPPFPVVVSLNIKEEEDAYSMDQQPNPRGGNNISPVGDAIYRRQYKDINPIKCSQKTPSCSVSSGSGKVLRSSEITTDSRREILPECNQGMEVNMTWCENSFGNTSQATFQPPPVKMGTSYKDNVCERNLSTAVPGACIQRTQQNDRPYMWVDYEKNVSPNEYSIRYKRTHTEVGSQERPYTCTDCEKSFSLKCDLNRHWRTHTGEKPYACTDCQKSFSLKGDLNRHQRIHTGEKPYTCTDCNKSFSRKYILSVHKRTHIERGAYQNENPGSYYRPEDYRTVNGDLDN